MKTDTQFIFLSLVTLALALPSVVPQGRAETLMENELNFRLRPSDLVRGDIQISLEFPESLEKARRSSFRLLDPDRSLDGDGQRAVFSKTAFVVNRPVSFFQGNEPYALPMVRKLSKDTTVTQGPSPGEFDMSTSHWLAGTTKFKTKIQPLRERTFRSHPWAAKAFEQLRARGGEKPEQLSLQTSSDFNQIFRRSSSLNAYYPCGSGRTLVVGWHLATVDDRGWDWINGLPFVSPKSVLTDQAVSGVEHVFKVLNATNE